MGFSFWSLEWNSFTKCLGVHHSRLIFDRYSADLYAISIFRFHFREVFLGYSFCLFETKSLCSIGWPWTYNPFASDSHVCTTMMLCIIVSNVDSLFSACWILLLLQLWLLWILLPVSLSQFFLLSVLSLPFFSFHC
jgi:hypothetical protein